MKKINKNLFVFIFVSLFIIAGLCSPDLWNGMKNAVKEFVKSDKPVDTKIEKLIDDVQDISTKKLTYHDDMLDINSFVLNKTGTDYVKKNSDVVVKADNDYLAYGVPKMNDETLTKYADNISELYEYTKKNNIPFLYVMTPQKGYGLEYPAGTDNFIKENCTTHLKNLDKRGVPYLEIRQCMENEGISEEEAFFITDHHWKPKTAIWATEKICSELNTRYGFEYDKSVFDLSNYNIKTYEDWFLGSQGKKVGRFFTDLYVDDIDIITPKFDTSLTVSQPLKKETKTGTFEETLISKVRIEKKGYYDYNPYVAYTGGDYHIQTVENLNKKDGKDILVIRDSFAAASTPFLSLTAHNTHMLDLREMAGMYGPRVASVSEYIEEMKPDYVIVMYYGVNKDDKKCTFELSK